MKHVTINQSKTDSSICRRLFIAIIITTCFMNVSSQEINIYNSIRPESTNYDYSYTPDNKYKKKFWRATAEWSVAQILPWSYNRYIRKADFAKITLKSILHNLKPENINWDDNQFLTNQLSHPYQGSLYFNSFRSNGYNFWESSIAVLAGTFTWETVCETHPPAPNDLVNTALGGIVLGEMSNRLSQVILRKKPRKSKAIIREPLAFMVNPMGSLNRLLDNMTGKPTGQPGWDNPPVNIVADAGQRIISRRGKSNSGKANLELFGRINIQYGDPMSDFKKPFSNFSLITEIGTSDTALVNTFQIEGCIYGKKIKQTNKSGHVFTVAMNYDYFKNSSFVFGEQSIGANLHAWYNISKKLQFQFRAGAGIIALAALPNHEYMRIGEGRNYDYGSGINIKAGAGINIANKIFYNINFCGGATITINGAKSTHLFYNASSTLRLIIYKDLSFSASGNHYYFNGNYKDHDFLEERHLFRYFALGYIFRL